MGYSATVKRAASCLRIKNDLIREMLAELLGSYLLIVFGDGSVAQKVLFPGNAGTTLSINFAYGLAVTFGVFASGGVTGGHINPAVSVAMAFIGRCKWTKVPFYALAQYVGCFLGACTVYGVYFDAITNFDGGVRYTTGANATAGIFATYPAEFVSTTTCLFDQILGTALLVGCILAFTDQRNMATPKAAVPCVVGALVATIGMAFGANCGYAINPARDLGPRLFTLVAGWGSEPFSFRNYNYFWVPIVGPHIGSLIGALVYLLFVELHWPQEESYDVGGEQDNLAFKLDSTNARTSDAVNGDTS